MLGMLLKDYYSLRSYFKKQVGLMLVLYFILSFSLRNMSFFSSMMMMYAMMMYMSAFNVDATSNWDAYACTTPVKPLQVVTARALLLLIGVWGVGGIATGIAMCGDAFLFQNDPIETLGAFFAVALVYTLVGAISLPIFYKVGAERGRMAMTLLFVLPFIAVIWLGSMWENLFGELRFESLNWTAILLGAVIVIVLLFVGSLAAAVCIYSHREY